MDNCGRGTHESVFVSSTALTARTVPEAVAECERRGLSQLELTSSFPYYPGIPEEILAMRRRGMRLLLHNYFPPSAQGFVLNLASANPTILKRSIEHCRTALVLSAEIGAPFFSVHAGFSVDPQPSELGRRLAPEARRSKEDAIKVFYDTIARLCETAETLGVALLIENNVVSRDNLVNGRNDLLLGVIADDFHALFETVSSGSLGMLLDVGHLKVSACALGFDAGHTVSEVRRYVRALHLSDNDGHVDNNQAFGRDAWFLPHLSLFPEALFVIETRPLEPSALEACMRIVEEAE